MSDDFLIDLALAIIISLIAASILSLSAIVFTLLKRIVQSEKNQNEVFIPIARRIFIMSASIIAILYGTLYALSDKPGAIITDCAACPEIVIIPKGRFIFGNSEKNILHNRDWKWVSIPYNFGIGATELTNKEFAAFLREYIQISRAHAEKIANNIPDLSVKDGEIIVNQDAEDLPVVSVSWREAKLYTEWLSKISGVYYRLPSEAEWEYSARSLSRSRFFFGSDLLDLCFFGNVYDQSALAKYSSGNALRCNDGFADLSPVKTYYPNGFGLYDTIGNVWEWVEDCWNEEINNLPTDGSPMILTGNCTRRGVRGGAFNSIALSGDIFRSNDKEQARKRVTGFRVYRENNDYLFKRLIGVFGKVSRNP